MNDLWGMDFVSDALFDGRRFRTLTIVDHFTHECLGIVADQCLRGEHVAEAMTRLVTESGLPTAIKVDNGSEFAGRPWIDGLMKTALNSTSAAVTCRRTMPWSNASTRGANRSASTSIGSCYWRTLGARSMRGDASITRNDPTLLLHGRHPQNRPVNTGPSEFSGAVGDRIFYRLPAQLIGLAKVIQQASQTGEVEIFRHVTAHYFRINCCSPLDSNFVTQP